MSSSTGSSQSANMRSSRAFSDGHESGIYSWDYLYWLGVNQPDLWLQYLDNLAAAGQSRGEGESAAEASPAPRATELRRPKS